jgi:radical SAM protein with 4Fe4S-binding SPASM domain
MVLSRYIGGCGAGRCYCAIQPNGDVTPCVYMPSLRVGNLKTTPFRQIWNCELFELLSDRENRTDHCAVCGDRAYCGGCRARAYAYTGDLRAGDPGCIRNKRLWLRVSSAERVPKTAAVGGTI